MKIQHLKLLAIAVVCAIPMLGSTLLYLFWTPESRMNYGELLEARPLPDVPIQVAGDPPFRVSELRGKWVMVTVDSGGCDEHCRRKLYWMRQVRKAQGKDMGRIERLWLLDDTTRPAEEVTREYDGTRVVRAMGSSILQAFPGAPERRDHVFIVDPLGNVILRYPRDADPNRMRKDISRLLRASRVG